MNDSTVHLAEIGCTAHEIISITGHESISEVLRYTKVAKQKVREESLRERVDGHSKNESPQTDE